MPFVYVGQTGVCVECKVQFAKTASTKVRCETCQAANRRRQTAEKLTRKRVEYNSARALARAAKLGTVLLSTPVKCERCDAPFVRQSAFGRFCEVCRGDGKWARTSPQRRDKIRARRRIARELRHKTDPAFVLNKRMSAGVRHSLNTAKGGRSWELLVGYTTADLMRHLERQFMPGMTWANRDQWDVDHIIPLSAHNFATADDPEFAAAWAITNLRPLWKIDNLKKSGRRVHLL